MDRKAITVEVVVNAPIEQVWRSWNEPEHITQWCFASDDWEAPHAENDLRVGGKLKTRMQAKDGSVGFDFGATYTEVRPNECIAYEMGDGRRVEITFAVVPEGVKIIETFDMEHENAEELQRSGWQAILDNFKKHTEST